MSSRCRSLSALVSAAIAAAIAWPVHAAGDGPLLRVCADPDNLPYSNADEAGFENRIARLLADDLHAQLRYEWQPQRRGFVRKTIGAGLCDVIIGVPVGFERVATTRPYYRSTYVFVNRADAPRALESFDDPRLPELAIGVQLVGDDLAATPPGHALARRAAHVVGYTVYGEGPAAGRAIDDLAQGRLDAALLWGPQAGWFAARSAVPLELKVAAAPAELAAFPFEFSIAVGVRRGDPALLRALDAALERRADDVAGILDAWRVPRLPLAAVAPAAGPVR
jgi:mxaJ protein